MLCLPSCKKDYLTDEVGAQMVGEWRLVRLYEACSAGSAGLMCENGFGVSSDFRLTVKNSGGVISYKDGERVWRNKLTNVKFIGRLEDTDVVSLEWKNQVRSGNATGAYLRCDTIYLYNFPDPSLTRQDDHILGDRIGVYARE